MSGQPNSHADLDWLAFRYAAGELSEEELSAFEELLATDERACIAVAQAVQLAQAVSLCEQRSPVIRPQATSHATEGSLDRTVNRGWIAACTIAFSLVCVVWVAQQVPKEHPSTNVTSAVAARWIDSADDETDSETMLAEETSDELTDEEPVPEWLLAALNGQQITDEKTMMQD